MTPDELTTWNQCACVWRCLIKLANANGNPINREEFFTQFHNLLPNGINYGGFDPVSLGKILSLLGLPERSHISDNYSVIERDFNANKRHILIMSQIDLNPGKTNIGKHCSVLTKINEESFSVWTPCQDGSDVELTLGKSDWQAKKCFGLAIF